MISSTMLKFSRSCVMAGGVAACISGCGELPAEEEVSPGEAALVPATSTLWSPAPGQNTVVLAVCWENPTAAGGTVTNRAWAQQAIDATWGNGPWIDFTWSDTCVGTEQVRIRLEDNAGSSPHTNGLGRNHGKVFLNHAFRNWDGFGNPNDGSDGTCNSLFSRKNCIERIAVHEFGHVLGLAHDQNRNDTSCPNGPEQGTSGDLPIGRPDPDSIMSYCPGGAWAGPLLSELDKLQIQRLYGGFGAPVTHGGTFAMRLQGGSFYRVNNGLAATSVRIQEGDGTRNMMVVRKQFGTGRVHYGDSISLQDQRTSLYYCPDTLVHIETPACGQCMPRVTRIPVTAGVPNPCYWTPEWTSTSIGGSEIHVNDPFILKSGSRSFSNSNTTSLRFLGDFFPN